VEIRIAFGLHDLSSKLLADCSTRHPDDASGGGGVVKKIWENLMPVYSVLVYMEPIHRFLTGRGDLTGRKGAAFNLYECLFSGFLAANTSPTF